MEKVGVSESGHGSGGLMRALGRRVWGRRFPRVRSSLGECQACAGGCRVRLVASCRPSSETAEALVRLGAVAWVGVSPVKLYPLPVNSVLSACLCYPVLQAGSQYGKQRVCVRHGQRAARAGHAPVVGASGVARHTRSRDLRLRPAHFVGKARRESARPRKSVLESWLCCLGRSRVARRRRASRRLVQGGGVIAVSCRAVVARRASGAARAAFCCGSRQGGAAAVALLVFRADRRKSRVACGCRWRVLRLC